MNAELKRIHCPDVFDLESFVPEVVDNFCLFLQIMVGPQGKEGEESFDIELCTPKWIEGKVANGEFFIGRHYVFVREYNYEKLQIFIDTFLRGCSGQNWNEIAEKVARVGKWEFEDYQE